VKVNPKIVSLGPHGMEAAAGVTPNPAFESDIQEALRSAPELLRGLDFAPDDLPSMFIGEGHYARVYRLPNGLVMKLTTDGDDAEAAQLIKDTGMVPGLIQVMDVRRFEKPVSAVEYDVGDDAFERLPYTEPLYAIISEPVRPLRESDYDADVARQMLDSLISSYGSSVPDVVDSYFSAEDLIDGELPAWADESLSTLRYFGDVLRGWSWLSERGYDVEDLHRGNFGLASPDRLVMFDFGHMSGRGDAQPVVVPVAANPSATVDQVFDEAFDVVEERFPDFGTAELYEDERAGADNGAGSERQFAYCKDGDPIIIAFAPKAKELPVSRLRGLMRHEFGHALECRYGVAELERRLGKKLPAKVERRADVIAEAVWGDPIMYDERFVQCVGITGTRPRPAHLPDDVEKLKANKAKPNPRERARGAWDDWDDEDIADETRPWESK
jgi:hypothetical protein